MTKKMKKLQGLVVLVCLFALFTGCNKTKARVEPPVAEPEVREQEKIQPVEVEPEEQPSPPPRSEVKESEFDQSLVPTRYPGIEGEFLESSMLKDIHFEFDRVDLSAQAREILAANATLLRKFPDVKVEIEGHCDERGSTGYNLALGERRAASVKNYLVSLGISPGRLSTISYGEEMPSDPGHNEEAWSKNRRAHMIIIKK